MKIVIWNPVNVLGLAFNIIIVVLGYWSYKKSKDKVPLYISIAFILFGISYLITLRVLEGNLESVLIIIRALAYLILSFAVYKLAFKR